MMSKKRKIATMLCAILIPMLPATVAFADAVTELNVLQSDAAFPSVTRAFTQMDATFARRNFLRTVAQVNQVQIGISKDGLVSAVGQPVSAYSDGSWNFDLSFRLPQNNRIICQYRVFFDDQDLVSGTIWRRPQCVDIINSVGN